MLTYHRTSLLTSQAQTIVNTVNTVGVMGKGLAAALKKQHPAMFEAYKRICAQHLLDVGKLWLWQGSGQWVLNFPTKKHWRHPSKLEYVELGLHKFVETFEAKGIREIAFPRLGCGNGGLDWDDVRPLMHKYLSDLPIRVYIHDYEAEMPLPEHKEYSPAFAENSFHDFLNDVGFLAERNYGESLGDPSLNAKLLFVEDQYVLRITKDNQIFDIDEFEMSEFWNLLSKGPVDKLRTMGTLRLIFEEFATVVTGIDYLRLIQISSEGAGDRLAIERVRSRFPLSTVAA